MRASAVLLLALVAGCLDEAAPVYKALDEGRLEGAVDATSPEDASQVTLPAGSTSVLATLVWGRPLRTEELRVTLEDSGGDTVPSEVHDSDSDPAAGAYQATYDVSEGGGGPYTFRVALTAGPTASWSLQYTVMGYEPR